jgi:heterodisulfide reductase subunit C
MEVLPHQVLKLLQMGAQEEIESSNTATICASCFVCSVRCPKGVRITEIMEAVRVVKTRRNVDLSDLNQLDSEELKRIPPIALVANQRKLGH